MKELSIENQIYLCKYWDVDKSLYTTIGLKEDEVKETLERLKGNGLYEQYRNLDEYEYEKIIKKEKKKSKNEKILDKYKFDKNKKAFNSFKEVLNIANTFKDAESLNLEKIYKQVAEKENVKSYIINNDCKRLLDVTYFDNKNIFEENGYNKKPTLREFILKELDIQSKNVISDITKKEVCESKEKIQGNKETISSQFISKSIKDIDNTFVKVSVKKMMEWSYYKGYLDGILRKTNSEG